MDAATEPASARADSLAAGKEVESLGRGELGRRGAAREALDGERRHRSSRGETPAHLLQPPRTPRPGVPPPCRPPPPASSSIGKRARARRSSGDADGALGGGEDNGKIERGRKSRTALGSVDTRLIKIEIQNKQIFKAVLPDHRVDQKGQITGSHNQRVTRGNQLHLSNKNKKTHT
jgi:hypothetical protein